MTFDVAASAGGSGFNIVIGASSASSATAPGSTLTAMESGSFAPIWVAAIEGYRYLLTDAPDTAAVTTAWAADPHYELALRGLHVELDAEQTIDPWDPFAASGGKLVLRVAEDADDVFGTELARRAAGAESYLTATVDRDAASVPVKDATNFTASGDAWLGTECFAYSSKSSTAFTVTARGKYAPFKSGGAIAPDCWGEHHRAGFNAQSVNLQPVVSAQPRVWAGKWVGLWLHQTRQGMLNTKADARCVFAGRIVETQDDPNTMTTAVAVEHVLDSVKEQVIGRDLWSATIAEGLYLHDGWRFTMKDRNESGWKTANALTVRDSPSGSNEIRSGYYTQAELHQELNTWWAAEKIAARLRGTYSIAIAPNPNTNRRTKIYWSIPGTAGLTDEAKFKFSLPWAVGIFMGYDDYSIEQASGNFDIEGHDDVGTTHHKVARHDPLRTVMFHMTGAIGGLKAAVENERGTFFDQHAYLPGTFANVPKQGLDWGIFVVDNSWVIWGAKSGDELSHVLPAGGNRYTGNGGGSGGSTSLEAFKLAYDDPRPSLQIRQVLILEMSFADAMLQLFHSTGTPGYNATFYDTLPYGIGLGIPGELLGQGFVDSVNALPGANEQIALVIDKPMKFADLLAGDLILRRAFLRWKDGGLQFATWKTPTTLGAVTTLTELNKAAPAGTGDHQKSATVEHTEWAKPIVKILYNRELVATTNAEGYRDYIELIDATAVDDAGDRATTLTVKARNTYTQYVNTGAGIEALAPGFLATQPLFSRPTRLVTRPIDSRKFESLTVGDVVNVDDRFARDPELGTRGIATRPATVTRKRWTLGGLQPGSSSPDPAGGEVDLMFLDLARLNPYAPCAQLDETANSSGYTAGYAAAVGVGGSTRSITVYAHAHSEATEAVDASYFTAGRKAVVLEIDPSDPASPQSWAITVVGRAGNVIGFNEALTGFSSAKRYRVVFDDYATVIAEQRAWCYQADDVDGTIVNLAPPRQYATGQADATYTANTSTDLVEIPPNVAGNEGEGRDVGHEAALIRLVNNLLDYKLAHQSPHLTNTVMSGGGLSVFTGWKLVYCCPVFLTTEVLSGAGVWRYVSVAPWFRSMDGNSASVRVSFSPHPPYDDGWNDVDRGSPYQEVTFTTTSTTWSTPAAQTLPATLKDASGIVWLYVEVSPYAQTRGLALFVESERV